jgi:hypothetical protein
MTDGWDDEAFAAEQRRKARADRDPGDEDAWPPPASVVVWPGLDAWERQQPLLPIEGPPVPNPFADSACTHCGMLGGIHDWGCK